MTIQGAINQLERHYRGSPCAMALWLPVDVRAVAKEEKVKLTPAQVAWVLEKVNSKQDANQGITWETLRYWIREVP